MNKPLDELRSRLRSHSSEDEDILNTTFKRVDTPEVKPTIEAKAERTKPMSNRTTKNNTGLENLTNEQLAAALDSGNTMSDVYPCVLEFKNRLKKYHETLGRSSLKEINRLEAEYQKYHQNGNSYGFVDDEEPEPAPPPPPPPKSLVWQNIEDIEADLCDYGPYIMEIYESDWDYIDRRPNNVHMRADQYTAKDWANSHKDDVGTISSLSVSQHGLMMVMLKAYLYHKKHPQTQAADNAAPF